VGYVVPVRQLQHRDGFLCGVDDPILGDACLSVFGSFDVGVAFHVVGTDDFYYQISAKPEGVLIAGIVNIEEQD